MEQLTVIAEEKHSTSNNKGKKDLLGQVFTPEPLAEFMVSLFEPELSEGKRILDPCIGPNTFFKMLDDQDKRLNLTGMEIDPDLITSETHSFFNPGNRKLIVDSFFTLPLSETFDFIIQNPPYVRQELLMNGKNSKTEALESLSFIREAVPSKSNLYVYFLLKSIFHLNENGRLIAVIYDSWLYSKFGNFLKEFFLKYGRIQSIYHLKRDVFPHTDIGATVIDFKRITNPVGKDESIRIYSFNTMNELIMSSKGIKCEYEDILAGAFNSFRSGNKISIGFDNELFKPIEKLSAQTIRRGTSPIINRFFIQKEKRFDESIPFVKDISLVRTFCTKESFSFLLAIDDSVSSQTKEYIESIKNKIQSEKGKYESLKKEINEDKIWYKAKLITPGNMLFNYYLRENIGFLLNENLYHSSDNFYILNFDKYTLANFAILNSTFTQIAILLHSRNQGNGLKKIQLYEFKQIPVIDINKLEKNSIKKLGVAGKKLKNTQRLTDEKDAVIREIDEILIPEYNRICKQKIDWPYLNNEIKHILR